MYYAHVVMMTSDCCFPNWLEDGEGRATQFTGQPWHSGSHAACCQALAEGCETAAAVFYARRQLVVCLLRAAMPPAARAAPGEWHRRASFCVCGARLQ